jgi:hypothetical protein
MTFWEKEAAGRFKEEGMNHRRWREADLMDYLDGRLSPEKQAALRADMAQDRALRLEVKQLEQTAAFTRAVPLREAPRNYLLTPAMVASPKPTESKRADRQVAIQRPSIRRTPSLLLLRLTTAVTAIAFVITVSLNLLPGAFLGMGGTSSKTASDQPVSPQGETTLMVAAAATPTTVSTPGALAPSEPAIEEEAAPNQEPGPMRMMEAPAGESAPAEETTPTEGQWDDVVVEELPPGMGPHPGGADQGIGGGVAESGPPMEMTQGLDVGGETSISDTAEAEKGVTAETTEEEPLPDTPPLPTSSPTRATEAPPSGPSRRVQRQRWWLSGLLGVVTLLLAGTTWWFSRRLS